MTDLHLPENFKPTHETAGLPGFHAIDVFGPPDDNRVLSNIVRRNGGNPDPRAALSGDIVYDGSGSNNCFAGNVFKTDDPAGIVSSFPCP